MNIDDARVVALTGAMLGDGRFEFNGAGTDQFMNAEGLIAVRDGPGSRGTRFALIAEPRRDADGLWSPTPEIHSITLQSLPPLSELLDFPSFGFVTEGVLSNVTRFELAAEHSAFAWVAVDALFDPEGRRKSLLGSAARASIEARRDGKGIEIAVEAHVEKPKRGETEAAPFTVRMTVSLTFATIALAGSRLWWRGPAERWAQPVEDQSGPLAGALTLDGAGGTPFFRGLLDLGPGQSEYSRGPWVRAFVDEHRLRLVPHRDLKDSRGFVSGDSWSQELIFNNLGTSAWQRMLQDGDEAVLECSGSGIGHVEGVTGRDAYDDGPHEQPISSVHIRLKRSDEGLRIAFDGDLGEMRQTPVRPPLGPRFHGDFLVPTTFLFARAIRIGNDWEQRRKLLELR